MPVIKIFQRLHRSKAVPALWLGKRCGRTRPLTYGGPTTDVDEKKKIINHNLEFSRPSKLVDDNLENTLLFFF